MIKPYYSKYSGTQIDEAVRAIIENQVSLEDLTPELVEEIKKWITDANGGVTKEALDKKADADKVVTISDDQTIEGKKKFNKPIELTGDDTLGRIYPSSNNTGMVGQPSTHFKQGFVNQLLAYQLFPIAATGSSVTNNTGQIGSPSAYWGSAYVYNIYAKAQISINNQAVATENYVDRLFNSISSNYYTKTEADSRFTTQVATSAQMDITNDSQIPSSKAVYDLVMDLLKNFTPSGEVGTGDPYLDSYYGYDNGALLEEYYGEGE